MQSFSDPYGILSVMSTRFSVSPAEEQAESCESTLPVLSKLRSGYTALNGGCLQVKSSLPDAHSP